MTINMECDMHFQYVVKFNEITQGRHRLQTLPPVLPSGELLQACVIFLSLYIHRYIMCRHDTKYCAFPLWPSRGWLQEVVLSVRCLQQVFLRAKPKAVCECEAHCLSLAATLSNLSLCANMTSSIKPEIRNVSLRWQRTEPRQQLELE